MGNSEIGLIISKATNSPFGDFLCLGMKILVMYLLKHYFGTIVLKKKLLLIPFPYCVCVKIVVKHFILFTTLYFILIYDTDMDRLLIYLRESK